MRNECQARLACHCPPLPNEIYRKILEHCRLPGISYTFCWRLYFLLLISIGGSVSTVMTRETIVTMFPYPKSTFIKTSFVPTLLKIFRPRWRTCDGLDYHDPKEWNYPYQDIMDDFLFPVKIGVRRPIEYQAKPQRVN
jgi:hypothetical protein